MAATKQRSSPARRTRGASATPTKKATQARKKAVRGTKQAADTVKPSAVKHPIRRIATAAALKGLKLAGRKAIAAAGQGLRSAAEKAATASKSALDTGLSRRLPIQVSVDVAVPVEFAWNEWMTFESFTEGVHRIEDVERDGDRLHGRTAPPLSADWEAEVVDEREYTDFAWRSTHGSDCAGLAAFRPLSERLTRIQLDLDVLPTRPAETLALTSHLAHRRAEAELRRFKAKLEFTNPDVYEAELRRNGSGPDNHEKEST